MILCEEYNCEAPHYPPITSSMLGPNILLSTLFSDTLNLCSSLWARDEVPCPFKTTDKIIVLM
jgi:hypothetical protein